MVSDFQNFIAFQSNELWLIFLKNGTMTHIWLNCYTINTPNDFKFYFIYSDEKNLGYAHAKFFNQSFSLECVDRINILTSNSNSTLNFASIGIFEIESIIISPMVRIKIRIAWAWHAIFSKKWYKTSIYPISTHIIRREILR